jgi:hypothetical protein
LLQPTGPQSGQRRSLALGSPLQGRPRMSHASFNRTSIPWRPLRSWLKIAAIVSVLGTWIDCLDTSLSDRNSGTGLGSVTSPSAGSSHSATGSTTGRPSSTASGGTAGNSTGHNAISTGSTSSSSGAGSTSGADAADAGCSRTEYNQQNGCSSDVDCRCGQWCVADSNEFLVFAGSVTTCETPCTSNEDCTNAASVCGTSYPIDGSKKGKTCIVNLCGSAASPGAPCDPGTPLTVGGTCVPVDRSGRLVCLPNGTATYCLEGDNNDDPFYYENGTSTLTSWVAEPQPDDAGLFCPAGKGCYAPSGATGAWGECTELCSGAMNRPMSCAPSICRLQDPVDQSWGYCLPCGNSGSDGGSAATCIADADCCEHYCGPGVEGIGYCLPNN